MANELKIKNGLFVVGNEQITGSLTVSQGITSSVGIFGTASAAISASWAPTSGTTLFTASIYQITSSWANNSSTASYANTVISSSFSTNSLTSSYANTVISSSFSTNSSTASSLIGFVFDNTSSVSFVTASSNVVIQKITSSYLSVDYNYVVDSASNLRVGNIFGGWLPSGSTVTYAEYVTTDLGDTSQVSMSIILTGSYVQLLSNAATSYSWSIRAMGIYL